MIPPQGWWFQRQNLVIPPPEISSNATKLESITFVGHFCETPLWVDSYLIVYKSTCQGKRFFTPWRDESMWCHVLKFLTNLKCMKRCHRIICRISGINGMRRWYDHFHYMGVAAEWDARDRILPLYWFVSNRKKFKLISFYAPQSKAKSSHLSRGLSKLIF